MISKILNLIPRPISDVERVIDYIAEYRVNNVCDTSPLVDQSFNVGPYILQFSYSDEFCQLKLKRDTIPIFAFNDAESIFAIRRVLGLIAVSDHGV